MGLKTEIGRGDRASTRSVGRNLLSREQIPAILNESREDYVAIRDDRLGAHILNPWEPPPLNFSFDVLSGMDIIEQESDMGRGRRTAMVGSQGWSDT